MDNGYQNDNISVTSLTCLFEGLRPHESRTFCPPKSVPFKTRRASSAQLLMHEHEKSWHN